MTIFSRRGIRTVINAAGTLTRLGGATLAPGVAEAMAGADAASVDMAELQAHASEVIAGITGAEAGLVTSGAAAGLMLGAAAAIAGLDPARIDRLPMTRGMRNEIVVARGHRNGYDHAVRAAGARLVEVGLPERLAGAGVRDAEPHEYAAALGERSAAVLWVATAGARPALAEVATVARAAGVPVIVDAAAELPPQDNLRRFLAEGADLVAFSGGKALGGPAGSGILAGRRELVMSAALQSLDLDVAFDQWRPPAAFIDKGRLAGLPRQGIGRALKLGKGDVVGLLVALEHFVAEGDAARHARWLATCETLAEGIGTLPGAAVRIAGAADVGAVPTVELAFDAPARAAVLAAALLSGDVPIHVGQTWADRGTLALNPVCLRTGEVGAVMSAIREVAGNGAAGQG